MDIVKAIAIDSVDELSAPLKLYAEEYILQDKKFPARCDVYFQKDIVATILLPPTDPETFEEAISRIAWATSTLNGTHLVFSHRAEIAISSTLSQEDLEEMSTPCLCIYQVSFLSVHSAVYPYTRIQDSSVVEWSENSPEFSPIETSEMLQTALYLACQVNTSLIDPYMYVEFLRHNGYEVTFHAPYTNLNFAYQ